MAKPEPNPTFHATTLDLLGDFRLQDGQLAMPLDVLVARAAQLTARPKRERERYFEEVTVLAARLARTEPEASDQAVAQLLALATLLIDDQQRAEKAFAASGVRLEAARRFLGEQGVAEVAPEVEARVRTGGLLGMLKSNAAASPRRKGS